ncbi:DNA repair protein RecO [Enterococcus pallens]|uniref:DNA repair protein RecO n=1 Tax=Enterococcus pallens ATCC BAA-351 TaxID=1158607 RepID=R2SEI6_9ENTE|nr:DNA repair protein RecO [Enterococcus pallens]EOH86554.1 DNA repair protein RecO [Enterococcus pallens ATCC BAA-351]EOU18350.1 DNA repair protein RecO [Enterococcus pallens ATCC BAA-351]OJG81338.1 DNA repair protein RecO [Enterococcus pallens]
MAQVSETKGLILFSRDYKEKDKLIKIFTESAGKVMFFAKGIHRPNNPLRPAIMPFTEAVYIGNLKEDGLSFLNSAKEVHPLRKLQEDIFLNAYGSYILGLVDAAIDDHVYDPALYSFTKQALELMDQGYDGETILNIFELQIMQRFGVALNWRACSICGKTTGAFDFSSKYSGILCQDHWHMDEHRYHADPRSIYFIRMFSTISYDKISSVNLKTETKQAIRKTIDQLYEEYVGLHLKSKRFIDQMGEWQNMLKPVDPDNDLK